MTNEMLSTVMSPESGTQRSVGESPAGMASSPPGAVVPRPAGGGPPPSRPLPPVPASGSLARRLDTLENKTVYLVDNGFGGGPQFMLQLQKWFGKHIPSVTTVVRRKTGHAFSDDNAELWEEVKAKGHAVVYGVAG